MAIPALAFFSQLEHHGHSECFQAGTNTPAHLNAYLVQASVMRGSIVEVLAWRGRVEFLLLSEPMAREMHWVNGQAVARTYR